MGNSLKTGGKTRNFGVFRGFSGFLGGKYWLFKPFSRAGGARFWAENSREISGKFRGNFANFGEISKIRVYPRRLNPFPGAALAFKPVSRGHFWPFLTIFDHFWQFSTKFRGHREIFDNFGENLGPKFARIYGFPWNFGAFFDHFRSKFSWKYWRIYGFPAVCEVRNSTFSRPQFLLILTTFFWRK